jgi:hypothetical protein
MKILLERSCVPFLIAEALMYIELNLNNIVMKKPSFIRTNSKSAALKRLAYWLMQGLAQTSSKSPLV